MSVSTLTDVIKSISCQIYGSNVTLDDLKSRRKSNLAITSHRYRNILVQAVEENYKGHDGKDIQAVMLGHKLTRDEGSSTTEIYGAYLSVCKRLFASIRRIKDRNYKTDHEIQLEKVNHKLSELRVENSEAHAKTHQGIGMLGQVLIDMQGSEAAFVQLVENNPEKVIEILLKSGTFKIGQR